MSNLTLNVKKKWFDMILSGEKKEEYRAIKASFCNKFLNDEYKKPAFHNYEGVKIIVNNDNFPFKKYNTVTFLNGMKTKTPTIIIECKGISIGTAKPEWSDKWQGEVFIIKLGEIIETKNIK